MIRNIWGWLEDELEDLDRSNAYLIAMGVLLVLIGGFIIAGLSWGFIAAFCLTGGFVLIQWGFQRWLDRRQEDQLEERLKGLLAKQGGLGADDEDRNSHEHKCRQEGEV